MDNRILNCPACNNTLTPCDTGSITVDICINGCGGIWFDRGELNKIDNGEETEGLVLYGIEKSPDVKVDSNAEKFCPVCKDKKMAKHSYSPKQNIEIDQCDICGGIWLDDCELEKIRELFKNDGEKQAYEKVFVTNLCNQLINEAEETNRKNAPWYEKLSYAIFGT